MGIPIERTEFLPDEYVRFRGRLEADLSALSKLLEKPSFGQGEPSVGTELEVHLIGDGARPIPCNEAVLAQLDDPQFTLEINRFNLEFNATPAPLAGRPFLDMRIQMEQALDRIRQAARPSAARVAVVGILPTLRVSDIGPHAMSDRPRYHALSKALRAMRGEPFRVHIEGLDSLNLRCDDVTLEGANTSFQVHLRVPPRAFAAHYNAAQLAAAPVLAVSGNSPFFAEHRLWEETRVALFKQSVDVRRRVNAEGELRGPARVSFGHDWIRDALEPFVASAALHEAILPVVQGPSPLDLLEHGEHPGLEALRLHHGTVWSWNRAVFDPADGGHLRIEHRALPAGPTVIDMVANAAFTLGLTLGLADRIEDLTRALAFPAADRNFYAAARQGLEAELSWPSGHGVRTRSARELVFALLEDAARGLASAGVEASDYEPLLQLIRARAESTRTGSQVQRSLLAHYARTMPLSDAFAATLEFYVARSLEEQPVHTWKLPS
jgi:gamma-glutamyl:cysteine ligase YbdK (ATP-grasp superfamily)